MPIIPFPELDSSGTHDQTAVKVLQAADSTALTALGTLLGTKNVGVLAFQVDTNAMKVWTGTAWRSWATT